MSGVIVPCCKRGLDYLHMQRLYLVNSPIRFFGSHLLLAIR